MTKVKISCECTFKNRCGVNFAKSCLAHENKKDARKVLEKVLKIIPTSNEIQKTLIGI